MKNIVAILAVAMTLGFSGIANAGFMEAAFGNTVTVANGDGMVMMSFHFNEDGSFTAQQTGGDSGVGTWTQDGNNICFHMGENEECHDVQDISVGESYSDPNEDGTMSTVSIVEGR